MTAGKAPSDRQVGDGTMSIRLLQWCGDFLADEDGPAAVEYAILLSLIIVVCLVAITALGKNASKVFQDLAATLGGSS